MEKEFRIKKIKGRFYFWLRSKQKSRYLLKSKRGFQSQTKGLQSVFYNQITFQLSDSIAWK